MISRNFISFFKLGNEVNMRRLLYDGEVFCKPLDYFTKEEEGTFRHDKYDGASHITQLKNIELYTEDGKTLIGKGDSGQLYHHGDYKGNVYCLFGVGSETIKLSETITPFNFNLEAFDFGDYAVTILKPVQFIERVKKEVERLGYSFHYSHVQYYDETNYQGKLGPFSKSNKFALQNEVRFWIPNSENQDLTIRIGNMEDIANIISKSDLHNLGYGPP